jgi:hypothetical protein
LRITDFGRAVLLSGLAMLSVPALAADAPAPRAAPGFQASTPPALPKWQALPRTQTSVPLATVILDSAAPLKGAPRDNAVALDKLGYAEDELLISGTAGGQPYTVRLLVRRPADTNKFSGTIFLEPFAEGEASPIWTGTWSYLTGHQDIWIGVSTEASLHQKADAARYGALKPPAAAARGEVLAQIAWLVRSNQGPFYAPGYIDRAMILPGVLRVYAAGWSQAGCLLNEFVGTGQHDKARRPEGRPLIDGYVTGACPQAAPARIPSDAAVLQVVTESEFQTPADAKATAGKRRDDVTKLEQERSRWYELAGTSRWSWSDQPQLSIALFQAKQTAEPKCAKPVSRTANTGAFLRAALSDLDWWMRSGRWAPAGKRFELAEDGSIKRDEKGTAKGGVRMSWVDVPLAGFPAGAGDGICQGYQTEVPLPKEQVTKLYANRNAYVERLKDVLIPLVNGRYLLTADADAEIARAARADMP